MRKRGLGTPPEETEVAWPVGWRLPQMGDNVSLEGWGGGFVEYVSFELGTTTVRVSLR